MTITRWYRSPREVSSLQERINTLFEGFPGENQPVTAASFAPGVDVFESNEKVVLKLDIPGVEEKDFDIKVENQTLSVRGERKPEAEENEASFERSSYGTGRRYGSFFRSFTIPTTVDTENVAASYQAGVLKLELKKKASAQPRQIKIGAAA